MTCVWFHPPVPHRPTVAEESEHFLCCCVLFTVCLHWSEWAMAGPYLSAISLTVPPLFIKTSLALTSFKTEFGLLKNTQAQSNFLSANIVSTFQAGSFFGAFAAYPL